MAQTWAHTVSVTVFGCTRSCGERFNVVAKVCGRDQQEAADVLMAAACVLLPP